jgi:hypothetical protein
MAFEDDTSSKLIEISTAERRSFGAMARQAGGAILKWMLGPEAQQRYPQEYGAFWDAAEREYDASGAGVRRVEQIRVYLQTPEMLERNPDLKDNASLAGDIARSREALERLSNFRKLPRGGLSAEELNAMGIQAEPDSQYDGGTMGRPYRRVLLPKGWEYRLSPDALQATDCVIVDDLEQPRLHIRNSVEYEVRNGATLEVHRGHVDYCEPVDVYFGTDKLPS